MLPCAIVLAGGKSSRFGSDKASAVIGSDTLTGFCVSGLLELFQQVIVVAKHSADLHPPSSDRVAIVTDDDPCYAAMIGIENGLRASENDLNYIVGCDMPLSVPRLISHLHESLKGRVCALRCDAEGRPQPLGGFYSKGCLPLIERQISLQDYRLTNLVNHLDVALVPFNVVLSLDPELRSFVNINTPADLQVVQAIVQARNGSTPPG